MAALVAVIRLLPGLAPQPQPPEASVLDRVRLSIPPEALAVASPAAQELEPRLILAEHLEQQLPSQHQHQQSSQLPILMPVNKWLWHVHTKMSLNASLASSTPPESGATASAPSWMYSPTWLCVSAALAALLLFCFAFLLGSCMSERASRSKAEDEAATPVLKPHRGWFLPEAQPQSECSPPNDLGEASTTAPALASAVDVASSSIVVDTCPIEPRAAPPVVFERSITAQQRLAAAWADAEKRGSLSRMPLPAAEPTPAFPSPQRGEPSLTAAELEPHTAERAIPAAATPATASESAGPPAAEPLLRKAVSWSHVDRAATPPPEKISPRLEATHGERFPTSVDAQQSWLLTQPGLREGDELSIASSEGISATASSSARDSTGSGATRRRWSIGRMRDRSGSWPQLPQGPRGPTPPRKSLKTISRIVRAFSPQPRDRRHSAS